MTNKVAALPYLFLENVGRTEKNVLNFGRDREFEKKSVLEARISNKKFVN